MVLPTHLQPSIAKNISYNNENIGTYESSCDKNDETNTSDDQKDKNWESKLTCWDNVLASAVGGKDPRVILVHLPSRACNDPRQSQAEEHIHWVRASNVSNGVVSGVCVSSCSHWGKSVWQGGSKSHEGDGSDWLSQSDNASKDSGDLSDNGGDHTDHGKSDYEASFSVGIRGWRNDGEEELPANSTEVSQGGS